MLQNGWGGGIIKGRDLYDYVWFISRKTPLALSYLAERMKQSGHMEDGKGIEHAEVIEFLLSKFQTIDYS